MIFYDNGLVVGSFSHYNDSNKPPLFLKEIIENPDAKNSKPFYLFADCGGYIICGDTIKIQMIDNCRFNDEYRCGKESWYKIVNKDTLLFLVSFLITTDQKEKEYWGKHYPLKGGWTRTFNSISIKPLLDYYWILKEKWFWCNTNDWKDYMAKIKQKKQKRGN
jgi:hypothetical protein